MKASPLALTLALGMFTIFGNPAAKAGPLPVYGGPAIDYANSPACLSIGDGVGCSLPLLNYLAGLSGTQKTTDSPTGYVIPTPQGALAPYIVLQAGGGAPDNSDLTSPVRVEDGFKSNDGGSDSFRATGQTSTILGNMSDPANNALVSDLGAGADLPGTWDVGLGWLIGALTPDGIRRQLMIGFDYNQTQNTATSLNYWALITVRDLQGNLADINYEIRSNPTNTPYNAFTTGKTIDSLPSSTDFSVVNGVTCVDTNGSEAVPILPQPGGSCPAGYEVTLNNAQSTSTTEIAAFLPELSAQLESLYAGGNGYDVVSVRMEFGCFGGTPTGSFKPGIGYLADSGATTNCENGGFADVFLLAGAPERVPEPGSLSLLLLALLGLMGVGLRKRGV